MPRTEPDDENKYITGDYNLVMLCGYKLYQQVTLSNDSDSRLKLFRSNVNPMTEPDSNDKKFDIYNEYKIHTNARKHFIQWYLTVSELCKERDELEEELIHPKLPKELSNRFKNFDKQEVLVHFLETCGFRAVSSLMIDRNDWCMTYERVNTDAAEYGIVDKDVGQNKIEKVPGTIYINVEKWPDEPPKEREEQIQPARHFADDYTPPDNDDGVIWINSSHQDRDKQKPL